MDDKTIIKFTIGGEAFNVSVNKNQSTIDEIKLLHAINKQMIKYNGLFYILDFKCMTLGSLLKAVKTDNIETLYSTNIYPYITSPSYRAEQLLLYRQIPIFKPLMQIIEEALKVFFAMRYIAAYFALVPVVEGLLRRWHGNIKDEINPNSFIKNKTSQLKMLIKDNEEHAKMWENHNIDLLKSSIKSFFARPDKKETTHTFNRNIVSHLLEDPEQFNSWENCLKLLSIIDLIAKCYTYEFPLEGGGIIKTPSGTINCAKYFAEGQQEITLWKNIFNSCAPEVFGLPVIKKLS